METEVSSITDGDHETGRWFGWRGGMEGSGRHWEPDTGGGEVACTLSPLCAGLC